jgi:hypothetical protein
MLSLDFSLEDIAVLARMNELRDSNSTRHHPFTKKSYDDALCKDLICSLTAFMQKRNDPQVSSSAIRHLAVKLLQDEKLVIDEQGQIEFLKSVDTKLEKLDEELLEEL